MIYFLYIFAFFTAIHTAFASTDFPLQVENNLNSKSNNTITTDMLFDCQPILFNPSTSQYYPDPKAASNASYLVHDKTLGTIYMNMAWPVWKKKPILPKSYTITVYEFGCASTSSYVLEIKKNGKRHALYTHVMDDWEVSSDGKSIALSNYVRNKDSTWSEKRRIIDIASKKVADLPITDCTKYIHRWSGGKLITNSGMMDIVDNKGAITRQETKVCAWSLDGKFVGQIKSEGFVTATTDKIINRIGFLPSESNVLYVSGVFNGNSPYGDCEIAAIDLKNPRQKVIVSFSPNVDHYHCVDERIELDLRKFTISKPQFSFRIHDINTGDPGGKSVVKDWVHVK